MTDQAGHKYLYSSTVLYCTVLQEGHKYLYSSGEERLTWHDSLAECELLGGWLVAVDSLGEQNCLVKFGREQGYNAWFWTDGRSFISLA